MPRYKIATEYSSDFLETTRPQPLTDNNIEQLIHDVVTGKINSDITDKVYVDFKQETSDWIQSSKLNTITGFDCFDRVDIINGCTQYIDNIYMQCQPQVLIGDYRYHERLGNWWSRPGTLRENVPLIIAMPFPSTGDVHKQMPEILDEALSKNICVHIDSAWLTASRNITFDLSHQAIKSVGISLSKGLGLGWNRIGLRWSKHKHNDSISIMNDYHMNNRALCIIGLHFIRNLSTDYLWNTHSERYLKIINDFNLTQTNSIHLAMYNDSPVGISPLIRYLENEQS